ncbi:hypothetical protein BC830DRAFT_1137496 [Chytriomyces sp. MP71]|nr:hypothetical protein BC830DRAFT_1137496 [Chytriomyces sp. MP71]
MEIEDKEAQLLTTLLRKAPEIAPATRTGSQDRKPADEQSIAAQCAAHEVRGDAALTAGQLEEATAQFTNSLRTSLSNVSEGYDVRTREILSASALAKRSVTLFARSLYWRAGDDAECGLALLSMGQGHASPSNSVLALVASLLRCRALAFTAIWRLPNNEFEALKHRQRKCVPLPAIEHRTRVGHRFILSVIRDALDANRGTKHESELKDALTACEKPMPLRNLQPLATKFSTLSSNVTLSTSGDGTDRFFIASSPVKFGSVVLEEPHPFAFVVSREYFDLRCHGCGCELGIAPLFCPKCRAGYCASACEKRDEASHTISCSQTWPPQLLDEEFDLAIKVDAVLQCASSTQINDFFKLKGHMDDRSPHELQHILQSFSRYCFSSNLPCADARAAQQRAIHLTRIHTRVSCNSFAIKGATMEDCTTVYGRGLFMQASLFNHACRPTCVLSFPSAGAGIAVRAARDVQAGEAVTVSYGPTESRMNRLERRRVTASKWFFECACADCVHGSGAIETAQYLDAFRCKSPGCRWPVGRQDSKCVGCCADVRAHVKWCDAKLIEARSLLKRNWKDALKLATDVCNVYSLELCALKDAAAQNLAQEGDFSTAAILISGTIPVIEKIFGQDSIEVAHELFKLCSLLNASGDQTRLRVWIKRSVQLCQAVGMDEGEVDELKAYNEPPPS